MQYDSWWRDPEKSRSQRSQQIDGKSVLVTVIASPGTRATSVAVSGQLAPGESSTASLHTSRTLTKPAVVRYWSNGFGPPAANIGANQFSTSRIAWNTLPNGRWV